MLAGTASTMTAAMPAPKREKASSRAALSLKGRTAVPATAGAGTPAEPGNPRVATPLPAAAGGPGRESARRPPPAGGPARRGGPRGGGGGGPAGTARSRQLFGQRAGEVGEDEVGAGPPDGGDMLPGDGFAVEPAGLGGGLDHGVLAAHVVGGHREVDGGAGGGDHVEIGEGGRDHG